jgi:two-component system KDP operon response regulator KdpE
MATILVIEDDLNIRKLAAVNLKARGHRVIETDTAQTGLAQWRDGLPALVLLDIKLPDLRGWDVLDAISADSKLPTTPVIVMTASGIDVEAGVRRFPNVVKILIKPFDIHDLIQAVEATLGKSEGP